MQPQMLAARPSRQCWRFDTWTHGFVAADIETEEGTNTAKCSFALVWQTHSKALKQLPWQGCSRTTNCVHVSLLSQAGALLLRAQAAVLCLKLIMIRAAL